LVTTAAAAATATAPATPVKATATATLLLLHYGRLIAPNPPDVTHNFYSNRSSAVQETTRPLHLETTFMHLYHAFALAST